MTIHRQVEIEVTPTSEEIFEELVSSTDPLDKLRWLRHLLSNITHEEIQRVREFILQSSKPDDPGPVLLNLVDQMIDQMAPVNQALNKEWRSVQGLETELFGSSGHTR